MEEKKIDSSLSVIRLISLILIIACHILQGLDLESAFWVNIGVQMFFFLSGYLYGLKDIEDTKEFYKKRFKRIMLPYIILVIIMLVLEHVFADRAYKVSVIIGNLIGTQYFSGRIRTLTHAWFISYILICYLITPLLQKLDISTKFIKKVVYLCLFIVALSYFKVINVVAPWMCNYIIGYYYSRYYKKYEHNDNKFVLIFVIIAIIFTIFRVILQYNLIKVDWPLFIEDNILAIKQWSHVLLGCSICIILYKILSKLNIKYNCILKFSDKMSYYIYLVHQIFILYYFSLLGLTGSLFVNIIIIFIVSIVAGVILYYLEKLLELMYNKWRFYEKFKFNCSNR